MKPTIIYVSGAPGSGKTTLAREISKQLNIPHISSDLVHGGVAYTQPDHNRSETIRDIFVPHLVQTAQLGITFVVDQVLQKDIAKETIIDKLTPHANVLNIHTQTSDPIARYKHNVITHSSTDVQQRKGFLLERAVFHASNLANTADAIELGIPQLVVRTDQNYTPALQKILDFIQENKTTAP